MTKRSELGIPVRKGTGKRRMANSPNTAAQYVLLQQ